MSTILNPRLNFHLDKKGRNATCTVDCVVVLEPADRKYQLDCALRGQDKPPVDPDDFLFQFPSKTLSKAYGSATVNVQFYTILGFHVLDEDWGTDEIYARLHLTDLSTHKAVAAVNSNVVTGNF